MWTTSNFLSPKPPNLRCSCLFLWPHCFAHPSQCSLALVNTLNLLAACGLRSLLALERGEIVLHVVERPSFSFTTLSSKPGLHFGAPTIEEFREMWKAWDLVSLGMIPSHLLHVKPIEFRHKCLFYLGHIPTQVLPPISFVSPHVTQIFFDLQIL